MAHHIKVDINLQIIRRLYKGTVSTIKDDLAEHTICMQCVENAVKIHKNPNAYWHTNKVIYDGTCDICGGSTIDKVARLLDMPVQKLYDTLAETEDGIIDMIVHTTVNGSTYKKNT